MYKLGFWRGKNDLDKQIKQQIIQDQYITNGITIYYLIPIYSRDSLKRNGVFFRGELGFDSRIGAFENNNGDIARINSTLGDFTGLIYYARSLERTARLYVGLGIDAGYVAMRKLTPAANKDLFNDSKMMLSLVGEFGLILGTNSLVGVRMITPTPAGGKYAYGGTSLVLGFSIQKFKPGKK